MSSRRSTAALTRLYGPLASRYDERTTRRGERFRARVIAQLRLAPGETVVDAGCGTGLAFAELVAAVGPDGRVVGVDATPQMLDRARRRVQEHGWANVELHEGLVQDVPAALRADAVLILLADEVLREPAAIDRLTREAPGARVAAGGIKWAPWWLAPVNLLVWWRVRRYVVDFENYSRPWQLLSEHADDLEVIQVDARTAFIAAGRIRGR